MKNIFSINLQNNEQECDRIIEKDISDNVKEEIRLANEEFKELAKKGKKPNLFARIQMICFYGSFLSFIFFIDFWAKKTFKVAVKENWILFSLSIVLFAASIIFMLIRTKLSKALKDSEEAIALNNKYNELLKHIMDDLGVPETRIDVDVFVTPYIIKNDERVNASDKIDFINSLFGFYSDSENIYFANIEHLYKVEKSCIKEIISPDYSVNIDRWLKDSPIKSEEYKDYNVSVKRGYYTVPKVYKIIFELHNHEYYIIIPEYDFDKIKDQFN